MKCENSGVLHIDGTYKLIKNRFPVMVLGITDIAEEFHPIAYCVTTHEKEEDFIAFFSAVKKLSTELDLSFNPDFLMMDASDPTYNAASKIFPDTTILMCYFHLMQNVQKKCKTMFKTEEEYESFQDAIYKWIDNEKFNKWQIFHSPPGYANTNSNIESFNRQIKGFTQKKKLTIFGMVEKCCEMVHYYSTEQAGRFNEYPKFSTKLNESALKIDKGLFKKNHSK